MTAVVKPESRGGRPSIIEARPGSLDDTELVARVFRVLGDATRLRILGLLRERDRHQAELVALLGAAQSRVADHLACLAWCGFIVVSRVEGRRTYYHLASGEVGRLIGMASCHLSDNQAAISTCRRVEDKED